MARNYINRLETENAILRAALADVEKQITARQVFLCGPKFTGTDTDGERKDWIATADELRWYDALLAEVREGTARVEPADAAKCAWLRLDEFYGTQSELLADLCEDMGVALCPENAEEIAEALL